MDSQVLDRRDPLEALARRFGWRLVVLFGSAASAAGGRDVDFAVMPVSVPGLFEQGRWVSALEALCTPRPVDLLLLTDHLAPLARFEVFRNGRCLFEEREGLFGQERDRAFFLYADSAPRSKWEVSPCRPGHASMPELRREVLERKLSFPYQFLTDLEHYADLDPDGRRREHYAIERLLQLLCESAADIGLQVLRARGYGLASSYREVFAALPQLGLLPRDLAEGLTDACAMRNVLTHLYDVIDLDRVCAAVEPALDLYRRYLAWGQAQISDTPP